MLQKERANEALINEDLRGETEDPQGKTEEPQGKSTRRIGQPRSKAIKAKRAFVATVITVCTGKAGFGSQVLGRD
jgi:hypothetical protein